MLLNKAIPSGYTGPRLRLPLLVLGLHGSENRSESDSENESSINCHFHLNFHFHFNSLSSEGFRPKRSLYTLEK